MVLWDSCLISIIEMTQSSKESIRLEPFWNCTKEAPLSAMKTETEKRFSSPSGTPSTSRMIRNICGWSSTFKAFETGPPFTRTWWKSTDPSNIIISLQRWTTIRGKQWSSKTIDTSVVCEQFWSKSIQAMSNKTANCYIEPYHFHSFIHLPWLKVT